MKNIFKDFVLYALKTSKKLEAELDAEIKRVREYLKRKELERISPTLNFGE